MTEGRLVMVENPHPWLAAITTATRAPTHGREWRGTGSQA